ncbi:hypothetical protein ONZ43_g1295 [Nemania bipapillata]|uniref:Uncharacterized protein n=1 Tax=Nemania bipapillata TaxID=110536 RepID=A0ACC2J505_9PEZI|nr:hypothetical protein ONZ43_g1295 [Nemania bipapillata]
MADAAPQTPTKKLFKPSSKTKTPTRSRPPSQSTQQQTVDDASSVHGGSPEDDSKTGGQVRQEKDRNSSILPTSISGKLSEALGSAENSSLPEADNPTDTLNSPTTIARYFKDQGNPEMSKFVTSLTGIPSSGSGENTPRPFMSSEANGTFRDTKDSESILRPTNKMGEPDVSNISQTAQPSIPSTTSNAEERTAGAIPSDDMDRHTHEIDNMGRPAHVERSFEIPFQRPRNNVASPSPFEKQRTESQDLGDFEDLPTVESPSNDEPSTLEDGSQDPPEEILEPSVHSTSTSITPIPKIPKIPHIDSSPPRDLPRLAQGLAGHVIDDVGNIVDASGEVLGHATGDLPAMVGKKVSDNGEVYGNDGEIVGYVSENFINPPPPTEIPGDVLGGLRVDHKGNILDGSGNIIGKFYQPPERKSISPKPSAKPSSPKAKPQEKPKEEQKPKVNAQTGGSPSDLFLDVKSTTDGIQLTIRIPTTFSRSNSESE